MARRVRDKKSWRLCVDLALPVGLGVPLGVLGGGEPFTATPRDGAA